MEFIRKLSVVILFCLIIFSFGIIHTASDAAHYQNNNVKDKQKDQSPTQMLEEAYSMLVTSSWRSWDMAKSYINQFQLKFFPPNVDFRSRDDGKANGGAGERMKEATQKSFEKSKEAVEETAKSAAEMMEQKVQKTAEKVKDTVSGGQKTSEKIKNTVSSGHDEL
ncbi:uncharacterized protein LOC107788766 [Nicotiana tabacum]|uniref:Uncharacterized protein LOC107788766 n=1 Tax=Nicotiana tabacum TaxID=4097 RepID=A0A1S3ZNL2_TOBAC|nr:PREDICTED: uncharacterized protein LOC107788766 [Nicotiana tabacum]